MVPATPLLSGQNKRTQAANRNDLNTELHCQPYANMLTFINHAMRK